MQGQEGRVRQRAHDLLPRGRQRDRVLPRSTTRTSCTDPRVVPPARSADINFAFNWAYIDADHIAYQLSGWYPQRAQGHLARLPDPRHRRSTTGRASTRRPARCRRCSLNASARTRSTSPTWSPGTTSRRRAGRRPTTSTPSARCYRSQMIEAPRPARDRRRPARSRSSSSCRRWRSRPRRTSAASTLMRRCSRALGQAARPGAARRDRAAARPGRARGGAPPRPRQRRRLRRRRRGHADGRLVAEARAGGVRAGARRRSVRRAARRWSPLRRARSRHVAERARVLDRLVGLRQQGPARRCSTEARPRGRWSRMLLRPAGSAGVPRRRCRRRSTTRSGSSQGELYGRGDCANDPQACVLRHEPLDGRQRGVDAARSRSRTGRRSSRPSSSRRSFRVNLRSSLSSPTR